jgi:hypothetical protein
MTDSSSSSTEHIKGTGFGTFYAQKEHTGVWYVDWFVPDTIAIGPWYDIWSYRWDGNSAYESKTFEVMVHSADQQLEFYTPAIIEQTCDNVVSMMRELENSLIYEAQHITSYWEPAQRTGRSTRLNFAYKNWNDDPRPMIRKNGIVVLDGWYADMDGTIILDEPADPEDNYFCEYNFSFFNQEDILTFLNEGLYMMNATPPASQTAPDLCSIPRAWRAGVILYASMQALRRLIFSLTFQEKAIIFGEDPQAAQNAIGHYKDLYREYSEMWAEIRKDSKSRVLPGIAQFVSPEYTLPGGRSRWFRYLYKS